MPPRGSFIWALFAVYGLAQDDLKNNFLTEFGDFNIMVFMIWLVLFDNKNIEENLKEVWLFQRAKDDGGSCINNKALGPDGFPLDGVILKLDFEKAYDKQAILHQGDPLSSIFNCLILMDGIEQFLNLFNIVRNKLALFGMAQYIIYLEDVWYTKIIILVYLAYVSHSHVFFYHVMVPELLFLL
ncbi:hypothetical protein ACJX0J_028566 [Zea mays]